MSDAVPTILLIQSSARREGSTTRGLASRLADRLAEAEGASVVVRDLADGVAHVDADWIAANFSAEEERSEAQRATLAGSDAMVEELRAASHVVVAAPIYNFGVPAALKAWVDQIARARVTFRYGPEGPEGLLRGKRAYIVAASGGTEVGGPMDFATGWLRHVLGFLGIADVTLIAADRQMARDDAVAAAEAAVDAAVPSRDAA
ncbi:MAG: NAD(P)H-dependent oxidoreductase [Pseudomonadota bacterium]